MQTLSIDIETYSSVDLPSCGVYRYVESPDFRILLFGYSVDEGPVQVVDLEQGEEIPPEILRAIKAASVKKYAFNANFERVCLSRYLGMPTGEYLSPGSWYCTMVWAATMGLPLTLQGCGEALHLDKQKLEAGKDLIRYFSKPIPNKVSVGTVLTDTLSQRDGSHDSPKSSQSESSRLTQSTRKTKSPPEKCQVAPKSASKKCHGTRPLDNIDTEKCQGEPSPMTPMTTLTTLTTPMTPCRHTPGESIESRIKWTHFKQYNARDVETELEIRSRLKDFPPHRDIWTQYHTDQRINDRGVLLDMDLVNRALELNELAADQLTAKMKSLTGLENPNSVKQLRDWLAGHGVETDSLNKQAVKELLETVPPELAEVLRTRQQLSKTSVKKYEAMRNAVCSDGRARGMFQFYGAPRTGRWAGRRIQLQNLPQNHLEDLETARKLVKAGDYKALQQQFGSVPDTLSQLIRTAFVPKPGHRFIVADYAAIEARVLAYLAGEEWRMDAFAEGRDIYCASASRMFGVPVEKHGINGHLRQKGKVAELALGYGGGVAAMVKMGALDMGLDEDELPDIVTAWREASPNIVNLWHTLDEAALEAVRHHWLKTISVGYREDSILTVHCERGVLYICLPSSRSLAYPKPSITVNRFDREAVTYMGLDVTRHWGEIETYGARLTENVVQAIARDVLADAIERLTKMGCEIVMHIHDEVVIEAPEGLTLEAVTDEMSKAPDWLPGILLRADGYECEFYRKE